MRHIKHKAGYNIRLYQRAVGFNDSERVVVHREPYGGERSCVDKTDPVPTGELSTDGSTIRLQMIRTHVLSGSTVNFHMEHQNALI